MKVTHRILIALCTGTVIYACQPAMAVSSQDEIEVLRSVLQVDRQIVVAENLDLTEAEAKAFWPVYHHYRVAVKEAGDSLVQLIQDYANLYPDVPEDRAEAMLKTLLELEQRKATIRTIYMGKVSQVIPASKALRFAQVEARLDLVINLELASMIPLVPTSQN
jgi:hypothetical protein